MAKLSDAELASQYGLSSSLINSSKELKALFKRAVAGGWTASRFSASLKNTKWWAKQSDTLRQYLTMKYADPATFKQKQKQAQFDVNALAVQVGAGDLMRGTAAQKKALADMVYNSMALGWSDDRIKSWLGARASTAGGIMGGEAGDAFDKLHEIAYNNGMTYGSWYTDTAKKIAAGTYTIEQAEGTIRKQAAAKYSAFADQIEAGQNVMDLAQPYIQSVSKVLEVPATSVSLSNAHVSKAMTTNVGGQAMGVWQFENSLRRDPLWRKTQNAQDSAMQTAHQVLSQMGMVF